MSPVAITGAARVGDATLAAALEGLPDAVRGRALRAERVTQLALAAAGGALAAAGHACVDGPLRPRHGIALGTALGCFLTNAAYQRRLATDGARAASPRLFAATVSNAAAGEVGIGFRLGGPAVTVTAGAAAGLIAIGHAADLVASGRADLMVAGGMDASGDELERWLADGGLGSAARVRDAAGLVVLEASGAAPPRAAVLGHGAGFTPAGDAGALSAVLCQALADADVAPGDVAAVALDAPDQRAEEAERALADVLGGVAARRRALGSDRGAALAAGGALALIALLGAAPDDAPVLVVQVCASGHAAALVAARAPGGESLTEAAP